VQNQHEILGEIIKNARAKADMTVETLANKVGVTETMSIS
jgi:DNA-binding XRE family transcriptional regulator